MPSNDDWMNYLDSGDDEETGNTDNTDIVSFGFDSNDDEGSPQVDSGSFLDSLNETVPPTHQPDSTDDDDDDIFGLVDPNDNMQDMSDNIMDFSQYEEDSPDTRITGTPQDKEEDLPGMDIEDSMPMNRNTSGMDTSARQYEDLPEDDGIDDYGMTPQDSSPSTPAQSSPASRGTVGSTPDPSRVQGSWTPHSQQTPVDSYPSRDGGSSTGSTSTYGVDQHDVPSVKSTYQSQPSYMTGGTVSRSKDSSMSSFASMVPKELDLNMIDKVIRVIDGFRGFSQEDQNTVVSFLSALNDAGRSDVAVSKDNEASVVKSVIEMDPDIYDGVAELMKAKNMEGAERVFYLIELPAHQLKNINFILEMMGKVDGELDAEDSLVSIRAAAKVLNDTLNSKFKTPDIKMMTPVLKIMDDVQKIMEG